MIFKIIWFILPAGLANIAATMSALILPYFNFPVDGYKEINHHRIFGDHKTFRGLIFGVIIGELVFVVQKNILDLYPLIGSVDVLDYKHLHWSAGFLLSFGALFGDLIKSFFKRQLSIKPGRAWFPFDQIDWAVGFLIAAALVTKLPPQFIVATVVFSFISHLMIKFIGYALGIDKKPI